MSADDGGINQWMLHVGVTGKRLVELREDVVPIPTREPLIDGVPVAVLRGQQSPLRAAASNPEHGFEELKAILAPARHKRADASAEKAVPSATVR